MNLYKKNPEIEGTICVQGQTLDDDTVVFGKEFDMFADPNTFPGIPVRLVRVEFDKLDTTQKQNLSEFEDKKQPEPPRHLGPITTTNFKNTGDGTVKMSTNPIPEPKKEVVEKKPTIEETIQKEEVEPVKISEVYDNQEFIEEFPGITSVNCSKILNKFDTFESLAKASNVDLRAAGVRSNFFERVRDKAKEVLEEIESDD